MSRWDTCPSCGSDAIDGGVVGCMTGLGPETLDAVFTECRSCGWYDEVEPDGPASMWPRVDPPPADLFLAAIRAEQEAA